MNAVDLHLTDSELTVGILGIIILLLALIRVGARWLSRKPIHPDPWSEQIGREVAAEEAIPLCHRCFTPHHPLAHFCPDCGAPVGACTNLLPFPYLFSIGHTLRIGTSGSFKATPMTIIGYFLITLLQYAVFAPVYWILLLRALHRRSSVDPPPSLSSPGS